MVSRASWVDSLPSTQSVIAVQKDPAPTSDGMRSEASKRATAPSSCMSSKARRRMSDDALAGSTPWFGLTMPPICTRVLAHSGEARYSATAWVASSSSNAAT